MALKPNADRFCLQHSYLSRVAFLLPFGLSKAIANLLVGYGADKVSSADVIYIDLPACLLVAELFFISPLMVFCSSQVGRKPMECIGWGIGLLVPLFLWYSSARECSALVVKCHDA